jgi:hypothetical protein
MQTHRDALVRSDGHLAFAVQGDAARTCAYFDLFSQGQRGVPFHADGHNQPWGNRRQNSRCLRVDVNEQPSMLHLLSQRQVAGEGHKANLGW